MNVLVTHILQNIFFCIQKKKEINIYIWNNLRGVNGNINKMFGWSSSLIHIRIV